METSIKAQTVDNSRTINRPFVKPEDQPKMIYFKSFDWWVEEETLKPIVIKEIEATIKQYKTWLEDGRKEINKLNNNKADLTLVALEKASQERMRERLKHLEKKLAFNKREGFDKSDTEFERRFKIAKEVPLDQLLKFEANSFALCPWHPEKTGSLKWYKKENRFHCFGCSVKGDAIDLLMKLNGVDFKTAVESLAP